MIDITAQYQALDGRKVRLLARTTHPKTEEPVVVGFKESRFNPDLWFTGMWRQSDGRAVMDNGSVASDAFLDNLKSVPQRPDDVVVPASPNGNLVADLSTSDYIYVALAGTGRRISIADARRLGERLIEFADFAEGHDE